MAIPSKQARETLYGLILWRQSLAGLLALWLAGTRRIFEKFGKKSFSLSVEIFSLSLEIFSPPRENREIREIKGDQGDQGDQGRSGRSREIKGDQGDQWLDLRDLP